MPFLARSQKRQQSNVTEKVFSEGWFFVVNVKSIKRGHYFLKLKKSPISNLLHLKNRKVKFSLAFHCKVIKQAKVMKMFNKKYNIYTNLYSMGLLLFVELLMVSQSCKRHKLVLHYYNDIRLKAHVPEWTLFKFNLFRQTVFLKKTHPYA